MIKSPAGSLAGVNPTAEIKMTIPGYDAWKLASPDDGDEIGTEEGDTCNRVEEPDEDAPRGYRLKALREMDGGALIRKGDLK